MATCLVCESSEGQLSKLTERGLKSIKEFSKHRENNDVLTKLEEDVIFHIHKSCQKDYTYKRRLKQNQKNKLNAAKFKETRSQSTHFSWKHQCLFCEEKISHKLKPHLKVNQQKVSRFNSEV